jgi:hypothetical protein
MKDHRHKLQLHSPGGTKMTARHLAQRRHKPLHEAKNGRRHRSPNRCSAPYSGSDAANDCSPAPLATSAS